MEVKARTKTAIKAGDRCEGYQGCYSQKSTMPSLLFVRPLHRQEEAEFEAFDVTPWSAKWLYTVKDMAAEASGRVRGV